MDRQMIFYDVLFVHVVHSFVIDVDQQQISFSHVYCHHVVPMILIDNILVTFVLQTPAQIHIVACRTKNRIKSGDRF